MPSYRNPRTMKRKLLNLQIFHGKIKGLNYPKNAESIMELGSGKLNDLINWSTAGIKRVYAIEIDKKSVEAGLEKYERLKSKYDLPRIITKVADVTKDYNIIIKDFKALKHSIDHIVCNFSIHYFLKDSKTINGLFKLIKFFLKIGGTFIFTALDGKKLYDMFQILCKVKNNDDNSLKYKKDSIVLEKKGITYFRIKREFSCKEKFLNYGQSINVYVLSIGRRHREFLVNISYITKMMEKNGFVIHDMKPFEEYKKDLKKEEAKLSEIERTYSYLNIYCSYSRKK